MINPAPPLPSRPQFSRLLAALDLPQLQDVRRLLGEALAMVDDEKRAKELREAIQEVERLVERKGR